MTRSTMQRQKNDAVDQLAWERAAIELAREDIRRGQSISDEDVDAWLDRFAKGLDPVSIPVQPLKVASDT